MPEFLADGRVDVVPALHGERAVDDDVVLEDRDVGLARLPGQRRVLERRAQVVRHRGVQPERLVERVRQVGHALEVGVRRRAALPDGGEDLAAQLGVDGGVVGELVDGPRERRGGGVPPRQEDRHDLVPQHLGVAGVPRDLVEERGVLVGLGELLEFVLREDRGLLDVRLHESLEHRDASVVLAFGNKPQQRAVRGPRCQLLRSEIGG